MEEVVYDTNELIAFLKEGKPDLKGFTTVFSLIEFPKSLDFEQLTVIYPSLEDYEEGVEISSELLQRGKPMPAIDIMIAAMCIRRNLTLLTRDNNFTAIKSIKKDFKLTLNK